jgi:two-component system, OmpR family, KDP operon response regulator KdpE
VTGAPKGSSIDPTCLLVVEDDAALSAVIVATLSTICPRVRSAFTVAEAIAECSKETPDLIVLDLGLPDGDGSQLLVHLREVTSVPIVVLSGREEDDEKVMLLDAGADDFITKPCSPAELLARVRGQLRRAAMSTAARSWSRFTLDGIEIDLVAQRVTRNGAIQRLTPTEWALLRALVLHAGKPLSTKQLWDMVWAREFGDPTVHIRVHITHLRRKVEPNPSMPRLIVTEPGLGYRFVAP